MLPYGNHRRFSCAVTLTTTADNVVYVYHGGALVVSDGNWAAASTVNLDEACVLAVKAHNTDPGGHHGLLASTSTGVVTDATWKCSGVEYSGWHLPGFDDTAWAQARVISANGVGIWGTVSAINTQAKWIWAQGLHGGTVYCRKTLC